PNDDSITNGYDKSLHLSNYQAVLKNECEPKLRNREICSTNITAFSKKIIVISDEIIINNSVTQQQEKDDTKNLYFNRSNLLNDTYKSFKDNLPNYDRSYSPSTKDKLLKVNSNNRKLKKKTQNLEHKKKLCKTNMSQKNVSIQKPTEILANFSEAKFVKIVAKKFFLKNIIFEKTIKLNVDSNILFGYKFLGKPIVYQEFIFPTQIPFNTIASQYIINGFVREELLIKNHNIKKNEDILNFYHEVEPCCDSERKIYCNSSIFEYIYKSKKETLDLVSDDDFLLFTDNENDIENVKSEIKNFYLDNEYFDFLMLEKFNDYISTITVNDDKNIKQKFIFGSENKNMDLFILKIQDDINNVIHRLVMFFSCNDLSFINICKIIHHYYLEKKSFIKNSDVKLEDFHEFLVETISNLDYAAYLFQPGLVYFDKYIKDSGFDPLQFICSKTLFFNTVFCLLMNPILKNKSVLSYSDEKLAYKRNHVEHIKEMIFNFRNINFVFSEILSFCLFSYVSEEKINDFIQHNVLFDLKLLKIINNYHIIFMNIFKYFFESIEKYKFVSKFIFLDRLEFIDFFEYGGKNCKDKIYILHTKLNNKLKYYFHVLCVMKIDTVCAKLKFFEQKKFILTKNDTLITDNDFFFYMQDFKKLYCNKSITYACIKEAISRNLKCIEFEVKINDIFRILITDLNDYYRCFFNRPRHEIFKILTDKKNHKFVKEISSNRNLNVTINIISNQ
ncbi:hypothetical protein GVAV_002604, partial [Gurleya vavrai]